MKRRKRVDTSSMTPIQLRRYKKTLAYVRKYTRDRREWQKAIKMGHTTAKSLQAYRSAKYGGLHAAKTEKIVRDASKENFPSNGAENVVGKLRRLLVSLEQTEVARTKILQEIATIGK